jgi:hypothetical protein
VAANNSSKLLALPWSTGRLLVIGGTPLSRRRPPAGSTSSGNDGHDVL